MLSFVTIIACGGEGKRFGSDKADATLGDVTLMNRAVAIARGFGGPLAIATRSGARTQRNDLPLLIDRQGGLGPIAALESAFAFAQAQGSSHALLIACDQPFLPADLARRLTLAIGDHGVAMPVSNGHDQNMAALWRVDGAMLGDYIAGGGRSLWGFAERVGMTRVDWGGAAADPFADVDTPGDLEAARIRIAE